MVTKHAASIGERNVRVAMRDGVLLATDIWRPRDLDSVPVLISRTPYGKNAIAATASPEALAKAGFAVVIQDCRGRFESEGEWTYLHSEINDGYDTVEWAAAQPWSNGRVGMFGPSYMGSSQWLAAIAGPPHLETILPECCAVDHWRSTFENGAFRLALRIGWTAVVIASMAKAWGIDDPTLQEINESTVAFMRVATVEKDVRVIEKARLRARSILERVYRSRPIKDNPLWHGRASWLDEMFAHESPGDSNWRRLKPTYSTLELPAVHVGGWYDIHLVETLDAFSSMRRQARSQCARSRQHLIVGPWGHWTPQASQLGALDFGTTAALDMTGLRLAWFKATLQGGPPDPLPPVRIFVMGENIWRDEQEWPLARTKFTPWYLGVDGRLGPEAPPDAEMPDAFTYDPADPVPTLGGRLLGVSESPGPFDQRQIWYRPDVLVYTSAPLVAPMELTGPVRVELWAATDVPDTDFTAILIDVHPDGAAYNLCEGVVRARHASVAKPLMPDVVYHFTIDLVATSALLAADHRLCVQVSSSSFPAWEPNPNTGAPIGVDTDAALRIAHQRVFHDALHPSHVVLPIIPRSQAGATVE